MHKYTTMNLDVKLLSAAQKALGTRQATETVHLALADVVRRHRVHALLGCEMPDLTPASLEAMRLPRTFPAVRSDQG